MIKQKKCRNMQAVLISYLFLVHCPGRLPLHTKTKNKKGGNFLLQEYFRRGIYFLLEKINSKKSPRGETTGVTVSG